MLVLPVDAVKAQIAAQPPSAPTTACAGPEHRQLDFWLGQWTVRWDASPGIAAGSGTNTVSRAYGGCVVQEDFIGGPSTGGLVGHSVSSFHAPAQRWRQTWVDNQGGYFALVGGPEGSRFVLVASRLKDGAPVQRMVFEAITERSLVWRWQVTTDAGANWNDQWVIHYTRVATPDASAPAMAERLFAAIGGRAAWAALRNTVNDSQQFRITEQGIRHTDWVALADGSWRSSLNRVQVNVPLPDTLFARPESPGPGRDGRQSPSTAAGAAP